MQVTLNQATDLLGILGIRIVGAIVVLIVGLVVAWILARITRGIFRRTRLDDRLAAWMEGDEEAKSGVDAADILGKIVFWFVMVFVLIASLLKRKPPPEQKSAADASSSRPRP